MIRALFVYVYIALGTALVLPWLILWTVLAKNPDALYFTAMRAMRLLLRLTGIRVHVEGLENIPSGPAVFAANHISALDPMAFIPAIPRRVAILVKTELFKIPILGTAMRVSQFVPVDRGVKESAALSVARCVEHLKQGMSFAIYPEGTRSPDGRLRPFKRGAFSMAVQAGVPVVPVSIAGAQKLMRKGSWKISGGDVGVRFGDPVQATENTLDGRDELLARVESLIAQALPPDQQPLPRRT
ncbi:MAG TPA: lysophospholipid acyltransferase family protein [Candidatus Cybelea sp.]|nr:lysophospholipid acyltransferase family protein [Candidatus Cybelea sp.]